MASIGDLKIRLGLDTTRLAKDLKRSEFLLNRQASKYKALGSSLTSAFTLPFLAIGGAGVKMATDLESSFAKIEGLVGVTGAELDTLKKAATTLGPQFGKSANEAAEALFFITSAGIKGTQAIETLEASLKAAAVGMGQAATIADVVTSALNAYPAGALSAAKATDVLTAAVREGKLEPDQLAQSFGSVLPIASAMGVQLDEVGAAFAAMSRTGTNASEAATQIRGILVSIQKPAKEAEDQLNALGLSSQGLRDQIRSKGLLSALETLSEKFEGNDTAAAKVFGNVRALTGVLDLMGSNADSTRQIFDALGNTTGDLDKAFAVTSRTAEFAFQKAFAQLKTVAIDIGRQLIPIVLKAVGVLQSLISKFTSLDPAVKETIVKMALLAASVGPALSIFGGLLGMLGKVAGFLALTIPKAAGGLVGLFSPLNLAIVGIGTAIFLAVRHWEQFRAIVANVMSNSVVQIAALSLALGLALKNVVALGGAFKVLLAFLATGLKTALAGVAALFTPMTLAIIGVSAAVVLIVRNWDVVKVKIVEVINKMIALYNESITVRGVVEGILGFWDLFVLGIKTAIGNIKLVGRAIGNLVSNIFDKSALKEGFKEITDDFVKLNADAAETAADIYKQRLTNVLDPKEVLPITVEDFDGFINGLGDKFNDLKRQFTSIFSLPSGGGGGDFTSTLAVTPVIEDPAFDINSIFKDRTLKIDFDLQQIKPIDLSFATDIQNRLAEVERLGVALGSTFDTTQARADVLRSSIIDLIQKGYSPMSEEIINLSSQYHNLNASMDAQLTKQRELEDFALKFTAIINEGLTSAIGRMSEAFGEALLSTSSFGQGLQSVALGLLDVFAEVLSRVGDLAISTGVAIEAIKLGLKSFGGIGAVVAGVALKALAAFVRTGLKNITTQVPALASGGIAFGPSLVLVGEYPGAKRNPEVIAPLDDLRRLIGDRDSAPSDNYLGYLSADIIYLAQEQAAAKRRVR